jgi:hypothetical protein
VPDKIDILQFMVVRPANLPDPHTLRRGYVHDDYFTPDGVQNADLFSDASESEIGKLVYRSVFCAGEDVTFFRRAVTPADPLSSIVIEILRTLPFYEPTCPNPGPPGALSLESLPNRTFVDVGNGMYVIPDRLTDIKGPLIAALPQVLSALRSAATVTEPSASFAKKALVEEVSRILGAASMTAVVFAGGGHAAEFVQTKRRLFDALYVLYILRRRMSINLEHVIDGLRALHALEALAIDTLVDDVRDQGKPGSDEESLLSGLGALYPSLRGWQFGPGPDGFPLIMSAADLDLYLSAAPIVHPLFARLQHYRRPFNALKPIGVGDLKVVKHWLTKYKAGEIAHIDNVLKGETKTRVHRHLEKTEEVFSFSNEQQDEVQRDTQSTDRFELKRETDSIIRTDTALNVGLNVNATFTGTGYQVVTGATTGFAYTRSQSDQVKTSANFAREVVDRAVKRVQTRTTEQRTTTKIFETEETNTHGFKNEGTTNVSGIYRWVDKEYQAQLYNYGKRMMFEFVLPEPAAFLVESRLRAYETRLDFPRPPQEPSPAALPQWVSQLTPASINEQRFRELRQQYDFGDLTFPTQTRVIDLIEPDSGRNLFSESGLPNNTWSSRTYNCRVNTRGYRVSRITITGHLAFSGWVPPNQLLPPVGDAPEPQFPPPNPRDVAPSEFNTFELRVAGQRVFRIEDNTRNHWYFDSGAAPLRPANIPLGQRETEYTVPAGATIDGDDVTLFVGFFDISAYNLSFHAELQLTPDALLDFQMNVIGTIQRAEQAKIDAANRESVEAYNAQMTTYRNRLAEIQATAISDLLQGESEATNRQVMLKELKRQCLAVLTKEFDSIANDDVLSEVEAMGNRSVTTIARRFKVQEEPDSNHPTKVTGDFEVVEKRVDFPAPDLPRAQAKGRYVQFLEQAFEWQQLSYLLYPYFWATPPKWIELMNRSDRTDSFLSAFLQAGSARVLLAVTPAYDEAVLHYLATGEPWEGGPSPVIGDPLYVPLYEEIRKQQDDLLNATADGKPWSFTLPTTLVYLDNSDTPLPTIT